MLWVLFVIFGSGVSVLVSGSWLIEVSKSMVENVGISVNTGVSFVSAGMSKSVGRGNVSPDMSVISGVLSGVLVLPVVCFMSILLKIDVCNWPI